MFHRQEIAVNKATGVPIPGVVVRLYDADGNPVTLYSDANGTPILSVSGIADAAVSDDAGNYSYYVANGVYTERIYVGDSEAYSIPDLVMQGLVTTIQTPTFADAATISTSSDVNLVIVSGTDAVGDAGTGRQFAYDATVDAAYVTANPTTSFVDATGRGFKEIAGSSAVGLSAALAASGGAALVGFLQSGTGAAARTAQDKLRDVISARDFGATGDGATDDSTAIQAALNAASAAGKALFVPKGTYLLGTRQATGDGKQALILVPTGTDITIIGEGEASRFTIANNFSSGGDYSFFYSADATAHGNVEISGIHIDGNGSNNLVVDSGANVRRGYGIKLRTGSEAYIHDCFFSNMAGRNVVLVGDNLSTPSWEVSRIVNNAFVDVGGAISGNENQDDHSSTYVQAKRSLVMGNVFRNTNAAFDPFASPAHACVAIEDHSDHALVLGNTVVNYGGGGNAAAALFSVTSQTWANNHFLGMKSNILKPYTYTNFTFGRLIVEGNIFEVDNRTSAGGTGFFQDTSGTITTTPIGFLSFRGNSFYGLNETATTNTTHGIQVCAADYLEVRNNEFRWIQANGILLTNHASTLGIAGGIIDGNTLRNCGAQSTASRPYSIYVLNPDTNKVFARIKIGPDNLMIADPQAVGSSPLNTRGIRVTGPGNLQDIQVHTPNVRGSIARSNRVSFTSTTLNKNVVQVPRTVVMGKADTPARGFFDIAGEVVVHGDATGNDNMTRSVTTGGSGNEATWAATTAYTVGQWIKLSSGKTVECMVAGTSGSSEPTPTTIGAQYTDGTVTWLYKDTAVAQLSKFPVEGSISTTTDASGDVTVTHGFGTTPGNVQVTASGTTFMVPQVNSVGATTFKVRFFDAAGAALATTAVTAYWRATA